MNTTKKGDKFEDIVFDIMTKELANENLPVASKHSKIFKKKGYFSRDRNKDIITDVSIEVTMPGADTWSILMVIECKNYNHRVPVDDIEEFYAKVIQIAGLNVKAVFATQNSLQSGGLNFAKSKGISVIRVLPDELIYVTRTDDSGYVPNLPEERELRRTHDALTHEPFQAYKSFHGLDGEERIKGWDDLLTRLFSQLPT